MLDRVAFEKLNADGLSGVRWEFFLLRDVLVVDCYEEFSRESKRHKPKILRSYSRLNRRDSTIKQPDVPLTKDIETEAKAAFIAQLQNSISVGFQS